MSKLYFEDFNPGRVFLHGPRRITREEIVGFVFAASFDRFARFTAPLQSFTRAQFDALSPEDRGGIVFAGFDKFGLTL